jgi:hypothetical protein
MGTFFRRFALSRHCRFAELPAGSWLLNIFSHPNPVMFSPQQRNRAWVVSFLLSLGLTISYGSYAVDLDVTEVLPWYYYLLAIILPFLCLIWVEACKKSEIKLERRAEKLRRLQFETRLGAWSPK